MKIHELLEGSNWELFKKGVKSGFEKTEKAKRVMKYHPVTKAAKSLSQFAKQSLKNPAR